LYRALDPASARDLPAHIRVHRTWAADVSKVCSLRGHYPSFIAFPDRYWPWYFSAVREGTRLIEGGAIDALFSTSPVPTALLIALRLKRRFPQLPWIADFRDPWVDNGTPPLRRRLEAFFERRVIAAADRIICNTPALRRSFVQRYPEQAAEKFVVITNGYDEADFRSWTVAPSPQFEIVYPGPINDSYRNPEAWLAAVRLALDRGWIDARDLKLSFIGCGAYANGKAFQATLDRLRLRDCTELIVERIPYAQSLQRLAAAAVVVVMNKSAGNDKVRDNARLEVEEEWLRLTVPAKMYEYLRLGRPILALVAEGAAAELLRDTGAATPLLPHEHERIAATLRDYYRAWQQGDRGMRTAVPPHVQGYSRESQAAQLAEQLNAVCVAATDTKSAPA
jgi:glycosyltransferase involved in cell wall biosynthesis